MLLAFISFLSAIILNFLVQIPVFRGAEKPLVGDAVDLNENLPGTSWTSAVDARQIEAEHAVSALIRFVNEYPGWLVCFFCFFFLCSF
jgi:inosine-uridine nucleoside N-ribohydrolase